MESTPRTSIIVTDTNPSLLAPMEPKFTPCFSGTSNKEQLPQVKKARKNAKFGPIKGRHEAISLSEVLNQSNDNIKITDAEDEENPMINKRTNNVVGFSIYEFKRKVANNKSIVNSFRISAKGPLPLTVAGPKLQVIAPDITRASLGRFSSSNVSRTTR